MRAVLPLEVIVSAATLLVACNSTTGPDLPPPSDDPGISVLTVAPTFATIGGERFVKLTAILSGSATRGASLSEVEWISSDTNVATVRSGGLVEGRKAGRVQIAASWKTAHGSATVVVLNQFGKKLPDPPHCLTSGADAGQLSIPGGGKC
ncbi:MAG TPA: Ig-like domain-containing protein [Gemmatimonadales bacterium]|nr:Ig-like domain-containing protein [Gemmatimonadales bacterium]